jgi:site-specific recombinase XerD
MDDLAQAFHFSFSRRAAGITAKHRREYVRTFLAWFKKEGGACPSDLTPEILTRYFAEHRARWKAATAAHHRWALKAFMAYLYREGYLLVNPWPEDLKFRPIPPRVRRVPTPAEALAHLQREGISRVNVRLRNRAIFELAYGCGLRKCELHRLNLADVGEDFLRVKGKGGKERLVKRPFSCPSSAGAWENQAMNG